MIRAVTGNEVFTILLLIGLVFIAIAKVLYPSRFSNFIYLPSNSKYLIIHTKEQKFFDKFDALLFINLIISLGVFATIVIRVFYGESSVDVDYILKLIVGIASFFLTKVLLERLLGSVFEIDNIIDSYLFQKTSYKNYWGLIMVPINALFLYNYTPSKLIVFLILLLYFILTIIGVMVSFKANQNSLKQSLFYIILYLCALEIAPYLIAFKLLQFYGTI